MESIGVEWKIVVPGVVATIAVGDQKLKIAEDGYLRDLSKREATLKLQLYILEPISNDIHGINVDGAKNIQPKKNLVKNWADDGGSKIYRAGIFVQEKHGKVLCSLNEMGLVVVGNSGEVEIWEISVVAQGNECYLRCQRVYVVQCYTNGKAILCPFFAQEEHNWPQMRGYLKGLLAGDTNLPPIAEYQPK